MYCLASVSRDELDLTVQFYRTENAAQKAMRKQVCSAADVGSVKELEKVLDDCQGEYFESTGACLQTKYFGTCIWSIYRVPGTPKKKAKKA